MERRKAAAEEVWRNPDLGACACSQLRRTARAASAIYDRYLAPVGLTVTQYAILVNIGRADRISRTDLADLMGMERTTLTRNLQPLERQSLIKTTTGGAVDPSLARKPRPATSRVPMVSK